MVYALIVATILVALAELGDKTQLLVLALATRFKTWQVVAGVGAAILALQLLATVAGRVVGNLIPGTWLAIVTGVLFVGFGVWTLRSGGADEEDEAEEAEHASMSSAGPVLAIAATFFLAELGDKTQIMTMTVAADPGAVLRAFGSAGPAIESALSGMGVTGGSVSPSAAFWGVWIGSTLGMVLADGLALVVGVFLGKRLPERLITRISGALFVLFGVVTLASALLSGR